MLCSYDPSGKWEQHAPVTNIQAKVFSHIRGLRDFKNVFWIWWSNLLDPYITGYNSWQITIWHPVIFFDWTLTLHYSVVPLCTPLYLFVLLCKALYSFVFRCTPSVFIWTMIDSILIYDWLHFQSQRQSHNESYVTTDGESASLSWCQAPIWELSPDLFSVWQLRVCWWLHSDLNGLWYRVSVSKEMFVNHSYPQKRVPYRVGFQETCLSVRFLAMGVHVTV
jgi:hypothetical protein